MSSVAQFYTENPLHVWQQVLGPKLHYHVGSHSDTDIFDQAIRNLYPYIDDNSLILDVGCGWGGPATLLENEKSCLVHGVTNSAQQYDHNIQLTFLADAHEFIPQQKYDTAIFIESLSHFHDANKILKQLKQYTNKIIIKDYLWYEDWYNADWKMYLRTKQSYIDLISQYYTITHIEQDNTIDIYNSCVYWYNNIITLPQQEIYGQIKELYDLTSDVLQVGPNSNFVKMILVVAE
jgi:2-polyprenyl-3-methyl-5-hydroxy-6-metoxy-1,4-benzoquinol methylase